MQLGIDRNELAASRLPDSAPLCAVVPPRKPARSGLPSDLARLPARGRRARRPYPAVRDCCRVSMEGAPETEGFVSEARPHVGEANSE